MRQLVSTAIVAVMVSLLTVTVAGALAQDQAPPTSRRPVEPAAVSAVNADRIDGRHAVGAYASRAKRAGKLVATNESGHLPRNIIDGVVTKIRITYASAQSTVPASSTGTVTATCPAGSKVVGGGFFGIVWFEPFGSLPADDGWTVYAENTGPQSAILYAYAVCLRTDPASSVVTASKAKLPRAARRP